jgi:hypothetical protein
LKREAEREDIAKPLSLQSQAAQKQRVEISEPVKTKARKYEPGYVGTEQ